mgnify:CR=1 FL=1
MIGDFLDPQHSYQPSVELLRTQKYVAGPLKNYFFCGFPKCFPLIRDQCEKKMLPIVVYKM